MSRFWKRVHKQAWGDARQYVRTRLGYAVFLLILLAAVVLSVKVFGTSDGWIDDLVGALIWIGALILVFGWIYGRSFIEIPPLLYEGMSARWRKAKGRVAELESEVAALRAAVPQGGQLKRDVHVAEAMAYLCMGLWGGKFFDAAASPDVSGHWEYKQFHQAAADGEIPIWGRASRTDVFEPVQQTFWLANKVDWFPLLKEESVTEPRTRDDLKQKRYVQLMTSRRAVEQMYVNQPQELLRSKSTSRKLSNLLDEGAAERNKLLRVLTDFDYAAGEAILVAWDQRVLAIADKTSISESSISRFRTLDTYEPSLHGDQGRTPKQEHLESMWNKKLQILRTLIDEVGEWR